VEKEWEDVPLDRPLPIIIQKTPEKNAASPFFGDRMKAEGFTRQTVSSSMNTLFQPKIRKVKPAYDQEMMDVTGDGFRFIATPCVKVKDQQHPIPRRKFDRGSKYIRYIPPTDEEADQEITYDMDRCVGERQTRNLLKRVLKLEDFASFPFLNTQNDRNRLKLMLPGLTQP
jgi:hypothetical protein